MAFSKTKLDPTGSGSKGAGAVGIYATTDTNAAVKVAGYFNSAANELVNTKALLVIASDATTLMKCTSTGSVVTVAALDAF